MTEKSSTSPQLEKRRISPPSRRSTLSRLRKPFSKENKSSPNLIGVKIKRFSEFENYSRGTLGGFSPLQNMSSPDIDSLCLEKRKNGDKECVLTQLTRKIGLGVYVRGRDIAAERDVQEGHDDINGDERETWYMFYPPPPSPSLVQEPEDWISGSSPEPDSVSSSPQPVPIVVPELEVEGKGLPRLSAVTQGSQYGTSNPTSPAKATEYHETTQDIDIGALILSAEALAEQYRDLLLTPLSTPRLTTFLPNFSDNETIHPFPLPSPLSLHPLLSRPQTPKTLRKIKRQHSLRKLNDIPQQHPFPLPSPTTPTASTTMPHPLFFHPPNTPLTPPPSATQLTTPLTPPPSAAVALPQIIRSPDFLAITSPPEPEHLHPTRLSLAAHPNRSPTPSQGVGKAKGKIKKARKDPPEPPPRESSRGRGGRDRERVREKERKRKVAKTQGGTARERGRDDGRVPRGLDSAVIAKSDGGGDVNEGGEGWL